MSYGTPEGEIRVDITNSSLEGFSITSFLSWERKQSTRMQASKKSNSRAHTTLEYPAKKIKFLTAELPYLFSYHIGLLDQGTICYAKS